MKKNGIPVVLVAIEPQNHEDMDTIKKYASKIGYPVILKASGGAGSLRQRSGKKKIRKVRMNPAQERQ